MPIRPERFFVATDGAGTRYPYSPGRERPLNLLDQEVVLSPAAGRVIACAVEARRMFMRLATSPAGCCFVWPARLFQVEPVGRLWPTETGRWHCDGLRVVTELPAHDLFGPQGTHVAEVIERAQRLTLDQAATLADLTGRDDDLDARIVRHTAKYLCGKAAVAAGRSGAYSVGWVRPRIALWEGADMGAHVDDIHKFLPSSPHRTRLGIFDDPLQFRAAITALVCRDLIGDRFTHGHYRTLTHVWADVLGPLHPDDPAVRPARRGDRRPEDGER